MTAKRGRDIRLHWPQHEQRIKENLQTCFWWRRLRLRISHCPAGTSNAAWVLIWWWPWRRLCSHGLRRNARTISFRLLEDAGAPEQHKASWAIDKSVQPWYSMKIKKLWFFKKKKCKLRAAACVNGEFFEEWTQKNLYFCICVYFCLKIYVLYRRVSEIAVCCSLCESPLF